MPSRSVGIWENHRSGRLPPTVFFITAPKPAADGNTGSQTALGRPRTPASSSWTGRWRPCRRCHAKESSMGVPRPLVPLVAAM